MNKPARAAADLFECIQENPVVMIILIDRFPNDLFFLPVFGSNQQVGEYLFAQM